jgi:hypothetical protein
MSEPTPGFATTSIVLLRVSETACVELRSGLRREVIYAPLTTVV